MEEIGLETFWKRLLKALQEWTEGKADPRHAENARQLMEALDLQEIWGGLGHQDQLDAESRINRALQSFKGASRKTLQPVEKLIELLKSWKDRKPAKQETKKETKPETKPEKSKKQEKGKEDKKADPRSDFAQIFLLLSYYDAIYDLLTSRLHRLDPVIGDAGCQWRVPFVLDLHDYLKSKLESSWDGVREALSAYEDIRTGWSCSRILRVLSYMVKENASEEEKKNVEELEKYLSSVKGRIDGCFKFRKLVAEVEEFILEFEKEVVGTEVESKEKGKEKGEEIEEEKKEEVEEKKEGEKRDKGKKKKGGKQKEKKDDKPPYADYLHLCKIFTANRVRKMDVFGLSGIQEELDLPFGKNPAGRMATRLADYSLQYMLHVLNEVAKKDKEKFHLEKGETFLSEATCKLLKKENLFKTAQHGASFLTHVFYGPLKGILAYQWHRGQPIIIDLRRLVCGKEEGSGELKYKFNGGAVLLFAPDTSSRGFTLVPEPDERQMRQVGMCIECYSILRIVGPRPGDEDLGFFDPDWNRYLAHITKKCSIESLILCAAATHSELPQNISKQGSGKYERDELEKAVEALYREVYPLHLMKLRECLTDLPIPLVGARMPDWNLVTERYILKALMTMKFGLRTTEYKKYTNKERTRALRIDQSVPFAPIHIYGCTYEIKLKEMAAFKKEHGLLGDETEKELADKREILDEKCTEKED